MQRRRLSMSDSCWQRHDRPALAVCVAIASVLACAGCDTRQQKPKVASSAAVTLVSEAAAQQTDLVVPPAAISGRIAPVDEAFARYAASSGLSEIEAAALVLEVSRNPDIRDYAQNLIRDHRRSYDELKRIVAPSALKLPTAPTGRHADMLTKLGGVSAAERDEAFLTRFGIDAHKEAIALFDRHAREGRDPALKRYAEKTAAALRDHLLVAQKLNHATGR
jgi:putative membrane protein